MKTSTNEKGRGWGTEERMQEPEGAMWEGRGEERIETMRQVVETRTEGVGNGRYMVLNLERKGVETRN